MCLIALGRCRRWILCISSLGLRCTLGLDAVGLFFGVAYGWCYMEAFKGMGDIPLIWSVSVIVFVLYL